MSSTDSNYLLLCANCGKGEEDIATLKACGACKLVKYCSRDCQKAHRPQHKKECRKRAAELHDEALFKQPPLPEDCPICFLTLPSHQTGKRYKTCCGKIICSGCIHAVQIMRPDSHDIPICPFCRTPTPMSDEDIMDMLKKRMEVDDAQAIYRLGCHYSEGMYDFPQDRDKALQLWHRSAELGNAEAYHSIGLYYMDGEGVGRDEKKAMHYFELAAIGGDVVARYNLGWYHTRGLQYGWHESSAATLNIERALKHYMIAVRSGDNNSLKMIQQLYTTGRASKDDYAKALKAYQAYLKEIKSDDRDKAAAFSDDFKYYE